MYCLLPAGEIPPSCKISLRDGQPVPPDLSSGQPTRHRMRPFRTCPAVPPRAGVSSATPPVRWRASPPRSQMGGCEDNDGIAISSVCVLPVVLLSLFRAFNPFRTRLHRPRSPSRSRRCVPARCIGAVPTALYGDSPCRALSALQCLPVSCQAGISNWTWKWNSLIRLQICGTDLGSSVRVEDGPATCQASDTLFS